MFTNIYLFLQTGINKRETSTSQAINGLLKGGK